MTAWGGRTRRAETSTASALHDALCPVNGLIVFPSCGSCDLIATVREDEQRKPARLDLSVIFGYELGYKDAISKCIDIVERHRISGYVCSCGAEIYSQADHHASEMRALLEGTE